MSRLEQKLKELGYKPFHQSAYYDLYLKKIENVCGCNIGLDIETKEIEMSYITPYSIRTQQDIDNLQEAFNEMQKDLEVLREYESK